MGKKRTHKAKQNKEITNSKQRPECKPWMDFIWLCKRNNNNKEKSLNLYRMWRNINIYSITSITIEQYQRKNEFVCIYYINFFSALTHLRYSLSFGVGACAHFENDKNYVYVKVAAVEATNHHGNNCDKGGSRTMKHAEKCNAFMSMFYHIFTTSLNETAKIYAFHNSISWSHNSSSGNNNTTM